MINVNDVHKRFLRQNGEPKVVLKGVTLTIPTKARVGLIGANGAGKSTLLRIIGGNDMPTQGTVERYCSMSWPMGYAGGLAGSMTGRQNAKFVCRLHGHEMDMQDRLAYIEDFANLGGSFDEQVGRYSAGMKSRLQFAMSMAFDFDMYISDEVTAAGDTAFKEKAAGAFKNLVDRSGLIMVSHGEGTLKQFCESGIWLHEGRAHWFNDINDALKNYKESIRR